MSRLVAAVDTAFDTDFAIVSAEQVGSGGMAGTQTFASSAPGCIEMIAGTKFAALDVRLERWDARPPEAADEWEDEDELPWTPRGDGPLRVGGFDGVVGEGLDVDGLGRARVRVLAAGRHRYTYSDDVYGGELAPERWLLQLWPHDGELDSLSGRPRRIAGSLPFALPGGWYGAFHEWKVRGWETALLGLEPFQVLHEGLLVARGTCTLDQFATRFGPWARDSGPAPEGWDAPAVRPSLDPEYDAERRARTQRIADAAGMSSIDTFRDALACLRQLDLVLVDSAGRYVANPAPVAAWEALAADAEEERHWRDASLWRVVGPVWGDLLQLIRWAPDQVLTTTPRRIAVRQSLVLDDVLEMLRLAALRGMTDATDPAADEVLSVRVA